MDKTDILFWGLVVITICGVMAVGVYAITQLTTYNDDCKSVGFDKQVDTEYVGGKRYIECARYEVIDGDLIKHSEWFEIKK